MRDIKILGLWSIRRRDFDDSRRGKNVLFVNSGGSFYLLKYFWMKSQNTSTILTPHTVSVPSVY